MVHGGDCFVEKEESMKYCVKCRTQDLTFKYCPRCGNIMRELLIGDEGEIFVKFHESDDVCGGGLHVGCGGIINLLESSWFQKKVFVCKKCCLRITKVE